MNLQRISCYTEQDKFIGGQQPKLYFPSLSFMLQEFVIKLVVNQDKKVTRFSSAQARSAGRRPLEQLPVLLSQTRSEEYWICRATTNWESIFLQGSTTDITHWRFIEKTITVNNDGFQIKTNNVLFTYTQHAFLILLTASKNGRPNAYLFFYTAFTIVVQYPKRFSFYTSGKLQLNEKGNCSFCLHIKYLSSSGYVQFTQLPPLALNVCQQTVTRVPGLN